MDRPSLFSVQPSSTTVCPGTVRHLPLPDLSSRPRPGVEVATTPGARLRGALAVAPSAMTLACWKCQAWLSLLVCSG
eukprot:2408244-Rhodomonas_salina.1